MGTGALAVYAAWIRERALPVWSTLGFDAAAGRFRERLSLAGAPLETPQRAMVQARQIHVFAHAQILGWAETGALAEAAMRALLRDFCDEGPETASFAFSIDRGGKVVSDVRDAYTHAFALFALAWLYRLNGDARLLAVADKVIAYIDAHLTDAEHGGLFDAWPVPHRNKRQNPLMHLLEAYLALAEAAPGRGYDARAAELVTLFATRLFDRAAGVLPEYFARDWSMAGIADGARVWEPGHHFEWTWLLTRAARLGVDVPNGVGDRLYDQARAHGAAPSGLLFDEVGLDCAPAKRSHRLWPHTEAIKAAVARTEAGDAAAPAFGDSMAALLLEHFLDRPFAGAWIDQIDAGGRPLVDYVPASSLYHLFLAATEAAR